MLHLWGFYIRYHQGVWVFNNRWSQPCAKPQPSSFEIRTGWYLSISTTCILAGNSCLLSGIRSCTIQICTIHICKKQTSIYGNSTKSNFVWQNLSIIKLLVPMMP